MDVKLSYLGDAPHIRYSRFETSGLLMAMNLSTLKLGNVSR